ncbi:RNA polymerase II-associated protein 1 [Monodelphis domestica]|uniref:RNA polymerase II-associated protein 1 n=1 Tax=Monodelphis domestica TaxID=13616 RepID=UPI0024E23BCB|nr:RNA polymerase II-associated protein 1 [Monodelphis domestica]XP_056666273.1 RNA polymerase II-associated protein 1 [Monodelphis domestica]XP_056666274.1 RNA polymerase II-associated protein 1 [Monodelphis domestica]
MLSRPKPGESEVDLLRFQNQFLSSGANPAVRIAKKVNKKGRHADEKQSILQDQRDVVTLDELPDLPPTLVPAPPKRARPSPGFTPEDQDPEERLDQHDRHITAVFTKIIEHDTSAMTVTLPLPSGVAFPRVFHRSQKVTQGKTATSGKRSIFAQEIAARRNAEANIALMEMTVPTQSQQEGSQMSEVPGLRKQASCVPEIIESSQGPHLITGEGLRSQETNREIQAIHEENMAKLHALSPEEILQEQQRLLAQLDPSLVAFLKSQRSTNGQAGLEVMEEKSRTVGHETHQKEPKGPPFPSQSKRKEPELATSAPELPVTPHKEWLHMDTVELEKLQWTQNLPPLRRQKTQEGMQQARFSLQGELLAPDVDLPTHLGLHHHGEEAERAGYSLQEIFHLARSQISQQRALALQVLAQIISKAQAGEFGSQLTDSVLRLLLDAGFLFLLRFSLDDGVDSVIAAAVWALRALLVSPGDEELLDDTFSWYQGAAVFPLMPWQEEEEEEDETLPEKARKKNPQETRPPPDLAQHDVIKGLLATQLLPRLRYLLEVTYPSSTVVQDILAVLIRVARHSLESATKVLECPRLIETLVREFLPSSWSPVEEGPISRLHGMPCAAAMKLLRVLASAGRNISARLMSGFDLRSRLCRFVSVAPQELAMPIQEAEQLNTESFRLWAVAATYGQGGDLYRELYPILIRALQSLPQELSIQPHRRLAMQRMSALITLLTCLTRASSSRNTELQAPVSNNPAESNPAPVPPSITWAQVSGLRPLLEPILRQVLKELPQLESWRALTPLPTACLLYLAAYYQAWSQQPKLCPGECLQDVERLSQELVLPLLSQPAFQGLWDSLRHCSPLCNPLACAPAPESIPNLVSLGCVGGCPPLSLAGSSSSFSFLTSLLSLLNTLARIHKGLCGQLASVLTTPGLRDYLLQCGTPPPVPRLTPFFAWALRHEYHLQYLVLTLAQRMAGLRPDPSPDANLYHTVALTLLSRLLPGSEYLAHELLLGSVFRPESLPEGTSGGPEAADFSDKLNLGSSRRPGTERGALLAEACRDLPSIRGCYLAHCTLPRPALLHSQALYQGEPLHVPSLLLPLPKEPLLPADWPFLPLVHLYHQASGPAAETLAPSSLGTITRALQWVLILESWRPSSLRAVPPAARLARLMCVFLMDSDLFREAPIQQHITALLAQLCQPQALSLLTLDCPLPGLASFPDLYTSFLEHFEAVSFGDPLFGALVLLPLQRRYSVTLRLSLFGEHVGALRALGLPLAQLPVSLENYTAPPEDNLELLKLYFQALATGSLCLRWCPVLYVVAVAHVNSFIFSQDPKSSDSVVAASRRMLQNTWLLTNECLKQHLLYYKLPNVALPEGFELYPQLPPLRQNRLQDVTSGLLGDGVPGS